eukprot:EG_transcript_26519
MPRVVPAKKKEKAPRINSGIRPRTAVLLVVVAVLGLFGLFYVLVGSAVPPAPPTSDLEKYVAIETTTPGDGVTYPQPGDTVRVHYTGRLESGEEFDSSVKRGEPFSFQIGRQRVIRGWDEGLQKLSKGEQARVTIQPEYAYGRKGTPGGPIPPNAVLTFDVHLIDVVSGH